MAVAPKKLDIAIGDLVEVGGRRYDVVSDKGGGVALEPAITQTVAQMDAEHGGRPLDEDARTEEKDPHKQDPRGHTRKRIRKIVERHRKTFDELAK
jgi:hypothetical protein